MIIRAYLRASTAQQDANRAKEQLKEFAQRHGQHIASYYVENESGRKLLRPRLMALLDDASPSSGEIILVESIDRLTRLTSDEWKQLKAMIARKGIHIVAVDLPTSHLVLHEDTSDDMTKGILDAVNSMLVDILAVMSSRDYETRRARAAQGIQRRKARLGNKAYLGRPENIERNNGIAKLLQSGASYSEITAATGASRGTIAKVRKRIDDGLNY